MGSDRDHTLSETLRVKVRGDITSSLEIRRRDIIMIKRVIFTASILCFVALVVGCQKSNEGALERAGERMDEAVENIKDGENPLKKKGPMEKLGESVDKQLDVPND